MIELTLVNRLFEIYVFPVETKHAKVLSHTSNFELKINTNYSIKLITFGTV